MTPTDLQTQVNYYNKFWSEFQFANNLELSRAIAILDRLHSLDFKRPGICDLGAGAGWFTNILGMFGPAVGVELSNLAVETARKSYPHCSFVCADIANWEYPSGGFDVVVSQEVIEHFEDHERYLSVAHGLLRPGGYLILTTPNAAIVMNIPQEQRSNQPIENFVNRDQLWSLLRKRFSGIQITSVIAQGGRKGIARLFSSQKVKAALKPVGADDIWESLACRLGYGLHLLATARKDGPKTS